MRRYGGGVSLTVRLQRERVGALPKKMRFTPVGESFLHPLFLAACLLLCPAANAQSIFTIAGGGTDDGRPATLAGLGGPWSVALDAAGNLYIADRGDHRIRKVAVGTGIISTVAGNGSLGFVGDGGPATAAGLTAPEAVAVDASGNLYIADTGNDRIRKVEAGSGIISTLAGLGCCGASGDGGPATAAYVSSPSGVALDAVGNLYMSDTARIRKVEAGSGIISTVAGIAVSGFSGDGGPATAAQLNIPNGVTLDASGNLYIADSLNHRIRKVAASSGIISTVAGKSVGLSGGFSGDGGPATNAALRWPQGVALDAAGNLYIADRDNDRIRKVTAGSGIISTVAGNGTRGFSGDGGPATGAGLSFVTGVSLDAFGNLYIATEGNERIRKVDAGTGIISTVAGNGFPLGFSGDGGLATAAGLRYLGGVALDASGNLYIVDKFNHRILKVAAECGIISTVAGNGSEGFSVDGGLATAAALRSPNAVALDVSGNLYILDQASDWYARVRKVAAGSGIISTVAGGGSKGANDVPATAAALYWPSDLTLDASGNLHIAEVFTIRKVEAGTGIISTVAGKPLASGLGDGGPATAAKLSYAGGVALDASGNLYIADTGHYRVRKVAVETGIISTVAGNGTEGFSGDGGPATGAQISIDNGFGPCCAGVAVDSNGNLYIADLNNHRIRKVASASGLISTVAGDGSRGGSGDGGPATAAALLSPSHVALDAFGNLYIGPVGEFAGSARVRFIPACVTVNPAELSSPADGSSGVATSPRLAWKAVPGAFRYDILLDTVSPPVKVAVANVTTLSFSPANLDPLTTYHWQVNAKGDPFCTPPSMASSDVLSFTTAGGCRGPAGFEGASP